MSLKSKGIGAERDLFHEFWNRGWAAIRSAASGATKYPSPDILAGRGHRRLAVEVKITKYTRQYLPSVDLDQLLEFARIFGAEPWLAVKFPRTQWLLVSPEDLVPTRGENYVLTLENAKSKGFSVDEVIK